MFAVIYQFAFFLLEWALFGVGDVAVEAKSDFGFGFFECGVVWTVGGRTFDDGYAENRTAGKAVAVSLVIDRAEAL